MKKAKENPSFTKPQGKPDTRKDHPGGGEKVDYGKYDREHPHRNTGPGAGYKKVGQASKQGGEDSRSHGSEKVDYSKFEKKHPHQGK
jgi:hypothetical protein